MYTYVCIKIRDILWQTALRVRQTLSHFSELSTALRFSTSAEKVFYGQVDIARVCAIYVFYVCMYMAKGNCLRKNVYGLR